MIPAFFFPYCFAGNSGSIHTSYLCRADPSREGVLAAEIKNFDNYLGYSKRLKPVIAPHVVDFLSKGVSIVPDFPANTLVSSTWMRGIFEPTNAAHVLHFVDMPNERCIERLHKRNRGKPEGSIEMAMEQFEHIALFSVPLQSNEGFNIQARP